MVNDEDDKIIDNVNVATFKVVYEYKMMGDENNPVVEDTETFVIEKVDGIWKVKSLKVIHGLTFDK